MKPSLSTHLFAVDVLRKEHLAAISEFGFERVEIWGMAPHLDIFDDEAVSGLAEWLSDLDMAAASLHAPFYNRFGSPDYRAYSISAEDDKQRAESVGVTLRAVEVAGYLGCDVVVVHGPGNLGESGPGAVESCAESLQSLADAAGRTRVRIGLENIMTPESEVSVLVDILKGLRNSRLGLCLDVGHLNVDGEVEAGLDAGREWLLSAHVSDNNGVTDEHLIPGYGGIDWHGISKTLRGMPKLAHVVLESASANIGAPPTDPQVRESLRRLADCWRRYFGEAL